MAVKAGNRIYLRGQTGLDLDQKLRDPADPAAQARQAMENARVLLEEAGSSLDHVTMVTTYLTDPGYRIPVYSTVAGYLRGNHTVGTGLIVKGLAMPELKVELDLEAVIPEAGPHRKYRKMNSRDWYGEAEINSDTCFLVDTGDELFLRGMIGSEPDGRTMHGPGFTVADAASQAEQAMKNARTLLEEAGSGFEDVMKTRIYIGDRAYREACYQAVGRHFGDTSPCSTGLIMRGFARPPILFEIDMAIIRSRGTPHQRLRRFHTDEVYRDGQKLGTRFCQSVRAGNIVHLRGQTGSTLDGEFPVPGRPREPGRSSDEERRGTARGGRRRHSATSARSTPTSCTALIASPSTEPSAGTSRECTPAAPASSSTASPAPRSSSKSTRSRSFRIEPRGSATIGCPAGSELSREGATRQLRRLGRGMV